MGEVRLMKQALYIVTVVAALACGAFGSAQAQVYKQGADLHEALQQDGPLLSNALNYIVGVVDALNGTRSRDGACFDLKGGAVPAARITDVVRAFLLKNPQMKEQGGSSVVSAALAEAWPCRTGQ
jgi:hypothetical protein